MLYFITWLSLPSSNKHCSRWIFLRESTIAFRIYNSAYNGIQQDATIDLHAKPQKVIIFFADDFSNPVNCFYHCVLKQPSGITARTAQCLVNRTSSMNVGSQFTTEILFCIISTSGSSITHGIGGKRCVKLVLLSIMSLNKHLQTNVLLPHAVKSDETAVRKHPYPSGVTLIGEGLSLLWPYLTDTAQSPHRC